MNRRQDPAHDALRDEYRAAEFIKLSRLIMIWVGMPVILFWSISDYQEWGLQAFWIAYRASFPLWTMLCFALTKLAIFTRGRLYQVPFVLFTLHILVVCSIFIDLSGGWHSRYFVGMPQITLAMSMLPFGIAEFAIIFIVYSIIPVAVATGLFAETAFFGHVSFQLYLTYALFSVLSFLVIRHAREQSFRHRAMLAREQDRQREVIDTQSKALSEARVMTAIAKTTQMLAHDVRKPFSLLKIGLNQMASIGDDPTAARALAVKIREHVGKAFEHVNGMLADVMEVSSDAANLKREPLSLCNIVDTAIAQVFRYDPSCHVDFSYSFDHSSLLHIDQLKIQRVFTNILDNARQAMGGRGRIWINSRDLSDDGQVEITLGNSNSLIPFEHIPKLFDAFFTSDKRGGTGLGLAICHKIVTAHGGKIWCKSSTETGTEFILTLSVTPGTRDSHTLALPGSSDEVRCLFEASLRTQGIQKADARDTERRDAVIARAKRLGRQIEILVVDDEEVYADGIRAQIAEDRELSSCVKQTIAATPVRALELCEAQSFDLVITDVDLGRNEISGFDLARSIRRLQPNARTCVHSNRSCPDDYRNAVEAGADAFLPKPMSTQHLIGLLAGTGIVCSVGPAGRRS